MSGVLDQELLDSAMSAKQKPGKKQLIKHLLGNRVTRHEAIKAKCFECDGMGDSGKCSLKHCPLWGYSPYKGKPSGEE